MPEIMGLQFSLQEVAKALIRDRGITEGYWVAGITFNVTAGDLSVNGAESRPTVVAAVNGVNLARVSEPSPLSVDASMVAGFPAEIAVE